MLFLNDFNFLLICKYTENVAENVSHIFILSFDCLKKSVLHDLCNETIYKFYFIKHCTIYQ